MTRYDLAGNPLPESNTPPATSPAHPETVPVRYDLAGNPVAASAPPTPAYSPGPAMAGTPPNMGASAPYEALPEPPRRLPIQLDKAGRRIGIACGLAAVATLTLTFVARSRPVPTVVPTQWTKWTDDDGITCDQPSGWTVGTDEDSMGRIMYTDTSGVVFESGEARVDLTTETLKRFVKHLMSSPNAATVDTSDGARAILEFRRKLHLEIGLRGFQPGKPIEIKTKWGRTELQPWTALGPHYGAEEKLRGYWVAFYGARNIATMNLQCPEAMWPRMKPVFQHEIMSLNENLPQDPQTQLDMNVAPPS